MDYFFLIAYYCGYCFDVAYAKQLQFSQPPQPRARIIVRVWDVLVVLMRFEFHEIYPPWALDTLAVAATSMWPFHFLSAGSGKPPHWLCCLLVYGDS